MVVLKGQSNEIFDLHYFHFSNPSGPLTNGLKCFRFWLKFRGAIAISRGMIPPGRLTRRRNIPRGD